MSIRFFFYEDYDLYIFIKKCNNFHKKTKVFCKNADIYIRKGIKRYLKMGLNVTQTMSGYQFENREQQRNVMKEIFGEQGASEEVAEKLIDKTIFNSKDSMIYSNAQLSILKAASQISVNGSLKETLKYLKGQPLQKAAKTPVLGELWNLFTKEQSEYEGIIDLEIDFSADNIFAA